MMLLVAVIYEYSERCTIQIFQNIKKKTFYCFVWKIDGENGEEARFSGYCMVSV